MAKKATRQAFGEILEELGGRYPHIVVLDADLAKSTKSELFAAKYPDRFFEMGIAEANMVGTGAGLALCGKVVFICSFACFVTGRYDQIRVSVAYSRANVRIVGTHAGIAIGEDGYSQMGLEDIACMRPLAGMAVLQPGDELETHQMMEYLVHHEGPAYLRLTRQSMPDVNDPKTYRFEFGKGVVLREGQDVTLLVSGGPLGNTLQAAEDLAKDGISARVVNLPTIKPLDVDLIVDCAQRTGRFVTVEDHSVWGGVGSAVAEAASEHYPVPIRMIGVRETFGESGDPNKLYEKYGLDPSGIARVTREMVEKKGVSAADRAAS
jgi:transketolase